MNAINSALDDADSAWKARLKSARVSGKTISLSRAIVVLMTIGTLGLPAPGLSAGINQSTGRPGGGDGQNALAGNGSDGAVGDNPNATALPSNCYHVRNYYGYRARIRCHSVPFNEESLATPTNQDE